MSRHNTAADIHGILRRAIASHQAGRLAEAEPLYRAVLDAAPQQFDALHLLGVLQHQQDRSAEAADLIAAALRERPDDPVALTNRSAALNALARFDEAIADCDRALAGKPDHAEAHNNRALALRGLGRVQEALAACERALRLKPGYADAYNNRGLALQALRRVEAALGSYDTALQLDPRHFDALNNRGIALFEQNRLDEALACFDRALAIRPNHAHAHWNRAQVLLLTGDFARGWPEHEWRLASNPGLQRTLGRPLWLGDASPAGKTILLHAEQGLGDTIQFCRYAPMVAARGARTILEVQKPLVELMRTLAGPASVIARGDALPDFDLHCPLLSLPLAFRTELGTIPAQTPYLRAPSCVDWEERLGAKRPRIGLVWSGNPGHKRDRDRSIPLYALLPLLDADATFVSLQKDVRAADAAVLKETAVIDVASELTTFADTAALVSALDLVIAVDTSVAHLTGALGKPLWLLLQQVPDWRWLTDRPDSPWYPAARLFRQDATRAWGPVVARVRDALAELVARKIG